MGGAPRVCRGARRTFASVALFHDERRGVRAVSCVCAQQVERTIILKNKSFGKMRRGNVVELYPNISDIEIFIGQFFFLCGRFTQRGAHGNTQRGAHGNTYGRASLCVCVYKVCINKERRAVRCPNQTQEELHFYLIIYNKPHAKYHALFRFPQTTGMPHDWYVTVTRGSLSFASTIQLRVCNPLV
jgi:hypothetical protein